MIYAHIFTVIVLCDESYQTKNVRTSSNQVDKVNKTCWLFLYLLNGL